MRERPSLSTLFFPTIQSRLSACPLITSETMAEIHQIATVPVTAHAFNADRSREVPFPLIFLPTFLTLLPLPLSSL